MSSSIHIHTSQPDAGLVLRDSIFRTSPTETCQSAAQTSPGSAAQPACESRLNGEQGQPATWHARQVSHCEKKHRQVIDHIVDFIARIINALVLVLLGVLATDGGLQLALPQFRFEALLATLCGVYLIWINRAQSAPTSPSQSSTFETVEKRQLRAQLSEKERQLDSAHTRIRRLETLSAQGDTWKILQSGDLRLESCTERALEQLLNTSSKDLMIALAKVRAAPICQISYNPVVDGRDLIILNTNPLKVYQRAHIFNWILDRDKDMCPTTKQKIQAAISPSSGEIEFFRGSSQERKEFEEKHLPKCLKLYENEMRSRRKEAILSVNFQFGGSGRSLSFKDLAFSQNLG